MNMLDWAFAEDLPTAEKLVLVYLASQANTAGIGSMDRDALRIATGYKKRSVQRLIKSLKDGGLLEESGCWYTIGNMSFSALTDAELEQLPEGSPLRFGTAPAAGIQIFDSEAVAQVVGDYVIDQLANFEHRILQAIAAGTLFHVEQEPEPLPDPVIENPLYDQLIDSGMALTRAYALSKADLEMGEERDNETPPVEDAGEDAYEDSPAGRFSRILDILHGAESDTFDCPELRNAWMLIEEQENKHTVKGEQDAFLLLYPQIVAAAKANVGKLSMTNFCSVRRAMLGDAPWDRDLSPVDKDDPALEIEIGTMLAELEATGNQQCQVQPRTSEKGDDGGVVQETLLGFHRRVKAKHNQMLQLKAMEIV